MLYSRFNSLKLKLSLPIILGSVIITVALIILIYNSNITQVEENVNKDFASFEKIFEDKVKDKRHNALMAMNILLNNQEITDLFYNHEREKLANLLLPIYETQLRKKYGVAQFQFHKPPATSFLRLHKLSKFGDDLSSFRETVIKANANKSVVAGIEVGRGGLGLRIVKPISKNGTHIGTVEFGLGIEKILRTLKNTLDIDYAIGIKDDVFKKARRFDTEVTDVINDNIIFYSYSNNELKENIAIQSLERKISKFEFNNNSYASYVFPIKDYSHNKIGYIALYRNVTKSIAASNASIFKTLLLIVVMSSFVTLIILFIVNKFVMKPIQHLSKAAIDFSNDNGINNFEFDSTDELGRLSKNLSNMANKINLQLQYLDNLPNLVTVLDEDLKILYANEAVADFIGVSKEDCLNQKWSDLLKSKDYHSKGCACISAIEGDQQTSGETISFAGNIERPLKYTGIPIKDEKQKIIGVLVSAMEITEIKEKEQYLTRNAEKLLQAMNRFATGDLTVKVTPEIEDDDIGTLFNGFNNSVTRISNLVKKLLETIEAVASAGAEISTSSDELALGSENQSLQTAEVASAIEEMTSTFIESTRNVEIVAQSAEEAGVTAKDGGIVIENTISGINNISSSVTEATATVELLGNSSKKIGKIVQVIDDIAEQTNLLALNASIEAARAGEHGRGFAVVADEVSKLAERTIKATQEISSTIQKIQEETKSTVATIYGGKKEVEKGKKHADEANSSLQEIIAKTDVIIGQITQVATTSKEQSTTVEQISQNVENINNVAQESALGIKQIAGAVQNLMNLTEQLQSLAGEFKLEQDESFEMSNSFSIIQNELVV
ncbi:MAG: hypothetical protein CR986_00235 [Ignavibacteriae bacterium]|nr:MAG: hypothetical protein CR986_00235 [Ignavibacteriota bacterium]